MAKKDETAMVQTAPGNLMPGDVPGLQALFGEGFAQEETFGIGDPSSKGSKKVPIYFGELIGPGGTIQVEKQGVKPDPVTGEVATNDIPLYLFNPLDPATFKPFRQKLDSIISSHQVAAACVKYGTLAKSMGADCRAQILFRWNGKVETRKGNQMNDVSIIHRIVDASGNVVRGESR